MAPFEAKKYEVFDLFKNQWALATAGSLESHDGCTIGWGSLGTIWTRPGKSGAIVTVYLHPARYTTEFLKQNGSFTVSFFDPSYKKALGYMGSHTGRNEEKDVNAGLTPVAMGDSVGYKEANLTFLCRKIYQHQFTKEDIAQDVQDYYKENPKAYPVNAKGEWEPHWMFIGEILGVEDKR